MNDKEDIGGRRPYSPVAETLFRKDLISAMKIPDNEPLTDNDYWLVTDTWKHEWEQGVQVPFNPGRLPVPHVSRLANPPNSDNRFTFPKKLMCMSGCYTSETHQVTTTAIKSEQMCNYDLDDMDLRWLSAVNGERCLMGATTISELEMERGIEDFEKQSWEKINIALRNNEDQDDSVICDVCRSSYCHNHSLNQKRKDLDDFEEEIGKPKHLTPEERSLSSRQKILKIESEFFKHVDLSQASLKLGLQGVSFRSVAL